MIDAIAAQIAVKLLLCLAAIAIVLFSDAVFLNNEWLPDDENYKTIMYTVKFFSVCLLVGLALN